MQEKKIKEGMKMMGMKDSAFYLSWAVTYAITYTFTAILWVLITSNIFHYSNSFLIFLWYWLYCLGCIPMALFVW